MMNKGYLSDEIFNDPTRSGAKHWEETRLYQAYTGILSYLEAIDKVGSASTSDAVLAYYEQHPLDQSYAGVIARYSGLKKDTVIAVLDLVNYSEFLANYDPTNLYPLPAPKPETIEYDNGEIVAEAEKAITISAVVYDELRNRTVTV